MSEKQYRCCFCAKSRDETALLVHNGMEAAICDACIIISHQSLIERYVTAERDSERLHWLTADLSGETKTKRDELLQRMPTMSYSAACRDIDIARGVA